MAKHYRAVQRKLPRLRANRDILILLEKALEAANLTHCAIDKSAQDAMRLYLETWVVSPLEVAISKMLRKRP